MDLRLSSITDIAQPGTRNANFGHYRVALTAGGSEHILTYTVELSPTGKSVSWEPSNSILSDRRIDVLVVAALTDLVVAFHRGERVVLPSHVPPLPVGRETAVIRI